MTDLPLPSAEQCDLDTRFWAKVVKTATCWLWTGAKVKGHGRFKVGNKVIQAHHYLWIKKHGPVPDGMILDHKECSSKACVRDDHLELTTAPKNTSRYFAEERTHCKRGHELTEGNTQHRANGDKLCKTCNRWRAAAKRLGMSVDEYAESPYV